MNLQEVKTKYFEFFKNKGHVILESASLVPANDPTTLFTGSGMQPMLPYLLGTDHPLGRRLADSQKCFRTEDIDEIGDNRHTTFFEMLGNWSFGDYFKEEQLSWIFEFLTDELKIDANKLYVSIFAGDIENGIPRDIESASIWKKLFRMKGIDVKEVDLVTVEHASQEGMQGGHIFYYGSKNWWSRAGTPNNMPSGEPGGPDSEMFFDLGLTHDVKYGAQCHPQCDCGRFIEIGNSVFMEYRKTSSGSFEQLPRKNVDFGGGLERLVMATQGVDIFTATCLPIISSLEKSTGKLYTKSAKETKAFRIITDHMRAACFLITDGVEPSGNDQGYFVRRLVRRAIRSSEVIGLSDLSSIVTVIADMYLNSYPEIAGNIVRIQNIIRKEEVRFRETLLRATRELEKRIADGNKLSGKDAFMLVTTYGLPAELIRELVLDRDVTLDMKELDLLMNDHQKKSRIGSTQKFKGGLADTHENTIKLHTVHHILLKALQQVLGASVKQRGSNITSERLRIDFSFTDKMTNDQKERVEKIVNDTIRKDLPVIRCEMSKEDAEKLGAEHEFGAKYPDRVSVYSIGPSTATKENPNFKESYSIEYCGGPHVLRTGEIKGYFKIVKEEAISMGIRRIKGILENN